MLLAKHIFFLALVVASAVAQPFHGEYGSVKEHIRSDKRHQRLLMKDMTGNPLFRSAPPVSYPVTNPAALPLSGLKLFRNSSF